jgi:hypothetical protein
MCVMHLGRLHDTQTRGLMLITKTLQSLANSASGQSTLTSKELVKEPYMQDMQSFITANRSRVISFLDKLMAVDPSAPLPTFERLDQTNYHKVACCLHSSLHTCTYIHTYTTQ